MRARILAAVVGLLLLSSGLALAVGYLQTFDGTPAAPLAYPSVPGLAGWGVSVHSRDVDTWTTLDSMDVQHGPDCSPPPATHPSSGAYADAVFQCNGHIMTAIRAGGYGLIYLTPPELLDFSAGEAVLRWDMSTVQTSPRDWVDLWISPYDQHLQLPLDDWLPDLQGEPRNAIHIKMDQAPGPMFRTLVIRDFVATEVYGQTWVSYTNFLTPSATRRDTFELRLSRNHIKFGMPGYNFYWSDIDIPDLGWDSGVVQLGHHSYNPTKCDPQYNCQPNTWHWDNVSVDPARPFTIGAASPAAIGPGDATQVQFAAPAPADAHLQFAGMGNAVEVSWNDGSTWAAAPVQAQEINDPGHFQNYWVPAPVGATAARVRAQGGYWGPDWRLRDFTVWSPPGAAAVGTPTPTPLPATVLPSPVTPVATLPPAPTSTAVVVPTDTPTVPLPTSTPTPTVSSTETPVSTPIVGAFTVDDSVQGSGLNQFNYVGPNWGHCAGCEASAYQGSNSWDNVAGETVTFAWSGTQLAFYGVRDPAHGIGALSVDGGAETLVDFYAVVRAGNVLLWTSPVLPAGTHTLQIRVTGTKNASSTGAYVVVDRVDVNPSTPPPTATVVVAPTSTPTVVTVTPSPTVMPATPTVVTVTPSPTVVTATPTTVTATPLPSVTPLPIPTGTATPMPLPTLAPSPTPCHPPGHCRH